MILRAFAKINLSLFIVGKRPDGYHEIDSVMQSVSLFDEIKISKNSGGINISFDLDTLPKGQDNIAYKAADLFFSETGIVPGCDIFISKRIPIAAGLAGGSADAAAVLVGLNSIFDSKMTQEDLMILGSKIGSDVPFCTVGGLCRCLGRGEIVQQLKDEEKTVADGTYFVLVKPDFPVSTKWAYENFDFSQKKIFNPDDGITLHNDLESVVIKKYPEIDDIKKQMVRLGAVYSQMSGSGPTVFCIANDFETAKKISDEMKKKYSQTFVAETVPSGVLF